MLYAKRNSEYVILQNNLESNLYRSCLSNSKKTFPDCKERLLLTISASVTDHHCLIRNPVRDRWLRIKAHSSYYSLDNTHCEWGNTIYLSHWLIRAEICSRLSRSEKYNFKKCRHFQCASKERMLLRNNLRPMPIFSFKYSFNPIRLCGNVRHKTN